MADWFKFYNDGLDSKGMQFAMSEQPLVTSVWLVILSEASKNRSSKIKWDDMDFELIGFARKVNVSVPVFNQSIGLLERIKYITRKNGEIIINGWEDLQSDYAKGLDRGYYKKTSKLLASASEVSTVRGEEKRVDEKREESALSHFPEAEIPSWDEFWDYCQKQRLVAEWYAKDKWLSAQAENWRKAPNWRAYVQRCFSWWESDGRPMKRPVKVNGKYEQPKKSLLEKELERI